MPLEELVAGIGLLGVIAYAVLAGADFGGGIWDLFAAGPRSQQQRATIAHAMGPVWEANHVWLIFVIVLLFTAFPPAFAALSVALFGPFHLVLIGITLRGAAFVFRGPHASGPGASQWGLIFGIGSVMTPVLLGMSMGAISAGTLRVEAGQVRIEGATPWLTPLALVMGMLALALCAYLAAVYLTNETQGELRDDFRKRALLSGGVVAALAVLALPILAVEVPHLWEDLLRLRALPVLACGFAAMLVSAWAMYRRRTALARAAAIVEVASLLLGWGLAQYPYLIYPDVTIYTAAAPAATLRFLLYALCGGMLLLVPSLWLLFRVFKSDHAKP